MAARRRRRASPSCCTTWVRRRASGRRRAGRVSWRSSPPACPRPRWLSTCSPSTLPATRPRRAIDVAATVGGARAGPRECRAAASMARDEWPWWSRSPWWPGCPTSSTGIRRRPTPTPWTSHRWRASSAAAWWYDGVLHLAPRHGARSQVRPGLGVRHRGGLRRRRRARDCGRRGRARGATRRDGRPTRTWWRNSGSAGWPGPSPRAVPTVGTSSSAAR